MAKYVATPVGSGFQSQANLNQNFEDIEDNFQRVLYRDGSTPNQMESNIDMNGNTIYNAASVSAASMTINGQLVVANETFVTELPDPVGQGGKFVKSDGAAASWQNILDTDLTLKGAVPIPVGTVADMKALTGLSDGARISTAEYVSGTGVGGGEYEYTTGSFGTADGYLYHDITAGGQVRLIRNSEWGDVTQAGAYSGNTAAANTAAIQAVIDAGDFVLIPNPADTYLVNKLQLHNELTIFGMSMWQGIRSADTRGFVFTGNGTDPIFGTGSYPGGTSTDNRNITIIGISAENDGARVLEAYTAHNIKVHRCCFRSLNLASTSDGTINMRMCPRPSITESNIICNGGAWAISCHDNNNGAEIRHNILTGGTSGGAVDIGQCQVVAANVNIIETSNRGFRVAETGITGSGQCSGVNLDDNYLEEVNIPYEVALGFIVRGLSIKRGYIGNTNLSGTADPCIKLGRVSGGDIGGGLNIARKSGGTEEVFEFVYNATSPNYCKGVKIAGINYSGGTGGFYKLTSFPASTYTNRLVSENQWQDTLGGEISSVRIYESQPITANVGKTSIGVIPASTYGGKVLRVDIIEATGTLGCTVDIGTTTSASEIATFDPSAVSLTSGSASVAAGTYWRPGLAMLLKVTAGAGTGNFRLRIVYQAAN